MVASASGRDHSLSPALLSALKCRPPAAVLLVPWSAAQRSCCGPAAQAAAEPLRDSLSCHFLCVAPGLLAGSPVCVRGLGVGSAAALQRRPPGRGPLQDPRAFHVAGGCPARDANPRLGPHKGSGWLARGRQDVCSRASAGIKVPAVGEACVPHQAVLCSWSPK